MFHSSMEQCSALYTVIQHVTDWCRAKPNSCRLVLRGLSRIQATRTPRSPTFSLQQCSFPSAQVTPFHSGGRIDRMRMRQIETERKHQMWKLSQASESTGISGLFPSIQFPDCTVYCLIRTSSKHFNKSQWSPLLKSPIAHGSNV